MQNSESNFSPTPAQSREAQTDVERMLRAIDRLNNEIRKIESVSGPSLRTLTLREQVLRLQERLNRAGCLVDFRARRPFSL